MRRRAVLAALVGALALTAGCLDGGMSDSGDGSTPTADPSSTARSDLPPGVDPSAVRELNDLPADVQDSVREARDAEDWVILESEEASVLGDTGYVRTDGDRWEFRIHLGTEMVDAEPVDDVDG